MKNYHIKTLRGCIFIILLGGFINTVSSQSCVWESTYIPPGLDCPTYGPDQLIFEDNFNDASLNTYKWDDHFPWANGDGVTFYTTNGGNYNFTGHSIQMIAKNENITGTLMTYCPDGSSNINTCLASDGLSNLRTFNYSSGMVFSKIKFTNFGKFEINCKLPQINGVWPAFWLFSKCLQEIDVFEFFQDDDHQSTTISNKRVRTNYHRQPDCQGDKCEYPKHYDITDFSNGFHTFSVEWDAYRLIWRVDGDPVRIEYRLQTVAGHPITEEDCPLATGTYYRNILMPTNQDSMNIIAGMGVKNFGSPSQPQIIGAYPTTFEVDYIKVWSRTPLSPLPPCNTSNIMIAGNASSANPLIINDPSGIYPSTLRASDYITTGGYTKVKFQQPIDVYWSAVNYIDIGGFETDYGTTFTAEIAPCGNGRAMTDNTVDYLPPAEQNTMLKNQPDEISEQKFFSIIPNPSIGVFTLVCNNELQYIEVWDMLGNLVYDKAVNSLSTTMEIDISAQPKGIYFLKGKSSDRVYTEKVVVQ